MNPIKFWLVIRDDAKRTFEVCGQASNENSFTNKVYAMQKAGMNVSGMTPPVGGKTASKEMIRITGYAWEDGLHDRLVRQHREITMKGAEDWE